MTPHRARLAIVAVLSQIVVAGCDRLDMYDQPRYEPLEPSRFFSDGLSARTAVEGTVARGLLKSDDAFYFGKVEGEPVRGIPEEALRTIHDRELRRFPRSFDDTETADLRQALMERGRERFDIYCSPCHGLTGDGDGMIVHRGFRKPPTYHSARLRNAPAGHFFDVISNGFGAMAPYAARIQVSDRWAIVAYIRGLQLSQHMALEELPEDERTELPAAREYGDDQRREEPP